MSNPTPSNQASPPIDPRAGLMICAASQLVPLFRPNSTNSRVVREMAMSAIGAYDPESRADYINVARTIAFSMAALALLAKAATQDMPMPELMRVYGRANALNRSADQSERTMMRRRACHKANPPAEPAARTDPGLEIPEPDTSADAAVFQAAVAEAIQAYEALLTPPPAPEDRPLPSEPVASLAQSAAAPPAANIRYNTPLPDIGPPSPHQTGTPARADQPRAAPYRATLLRNAAMPPVVTQSPG